MELLRLQERHISSNLEASEKSTFRQRVIWIEPPSDRIVSFLNIAGFLDASKIRTFRIIPELICGLVERWRPETHTFHMPCGECTITLEDVAFQLGVPISGHPIIGQNKEAVEITCYRHLLKVPDKTDIDGKRVKLTWLKSAFQVDGNSTPLEVMCAARAYILRLIGGMLMPDKSSAMVHTQYLQFLNLSWEANSYSWGSAILSFLYRELCKASKTSNVDGRALNADIGGCMVLLQSWAWYRMPFIAPICAGPSEFPLATRWHNKKEKRALEHKVTIEVRMLIDKWCESQFIWRPYLDEGLLVLIPERAYDDVDNWCSIMSLIHFALVEMFYGNRVLRQFGYHQPVPEMPLNMDEYEMIDTRGKSDSNWPLKHAEYIEKWNARATTRPRCDPLTTDDFDLSSSSYHYWFLQNSRPKLTTQADLDAWFLLFPSSGLRRGTSGSGSSSSAVAGGSRGARGRRAGRGAAEPEPEYAHQVEEGDVQFDTGSYAVTHGEPSWEAAIQYTSVGDDTSGQLWRVSQPQSFDTQPVGVDYMSSMMATTSLSTPLVSTGVGGAGPSIFTTSRRMNVESEEDSGDDGDGDRRGEGRVRNAARRYDDTDSSEQFGYRYSKAIRKLHGDWDVSYNDLPAWINIMQKYNPGTIADLETLPSYMNDRVVQEVRQFYRLFWTFPQCINAFKSCKPIIQVDGTFLYGRYKQVLLLAVVQDGNRKTISIAFALVLREDTDSCKYGHMTTNLTEAINSSLKGIHNLPIIAIVKATYFRLGKLFATLGKESFNLRDAGHIFHPRFQKELQPMVNKSNGLYVLPMSRSDTVFRVTKIPRPLQGYDPTSYRVNLEEKWCDCGYFQALKSPCQHAIAACNNCRRDYKSLVDPVYFLHSVCKIYEMEFPAIGSETEWHSNQTWPTILPDPQVRRDKSGRPNSTRIHNAMDMPQRERTGQPKFCGHYRRPGHTIRKCHSRTQHPHDP
ncbi:hypothetical protein GQ457_17G024230 [Hibiscus cannabinus]